jgi:ABC-type branched-subunit amino acid transport system substrate-binding protein
LNFSAQKTRPQLTSHFKITLNNVGLLLLTVFILASCTTYEESKKRRAEKAAVSLGPIAIAIVWPAEDANHPFINGVSLAISEINEAGGVLGRKLQHTVYEQPAAEDKHNIAKEISKNEDIIAVIGHSSSASAIPASITYEYNGILFLAPSSTSPALTTHDFQYIFRTLPSDVQIGKRMAKFVQDRGYSKIILLDDNSIYGQGLSNVFYTSAVDRGLNIVSQKAYFKWQSDYKPLISELAKLEFDAIFLAGTTPNGAYLIKQFREMGIQTPFFSGDGLDGSKFLTIAGDAAEGTVVTSPFNPQVDNQLVRDFNNSFEKRFHLPPKTWEAVGYDSVKLLAFAIQKSGSTVPLVVSSTLRFMEQWQGVTGNYSFQENGELNEKTLYFKEVRNGHFEFIEE